MLTKILAAFVLVIPFINPDGVFAHAFGASVQPTNPNLDLSYGGAAAVGLSFVIIGLFVNSEKSTSYTSIYLPYLSFLTEPSLRQTSSRAGSHTTFCANHIRIFRSARQLRST